MKRKRRIRYRILALAIAVITCLNLFSEPLVVLAETENGGSLSNELTIDQSDEWIMVSPGEKATLHVGVMADNLEIVTYKWINRVPDGEGNYYDEPIEGATGDTYVTNEITEPARFTCTINNGFGAEWYKFFYVVIENHLRVSADEVYKTVDLGEKATLEVAVSADDLTGITYQWYEPVRMLGSVTKVPISGATGSSFVTEEIQSFKEYYCEVTDRYDNIVEQYFRVGIENHFVASSEQTNLTVNRGEKATLSVNVSADDESMITYQWYTYDEVNFDQIIPGATGSVFETEEIQEAKKYYCNIEDGYGNFRQVFFEVSIENHLEVSTEKSMVTVPAGGRAELEVAVSADDTEGITYEWQKVYAVEQPDGEKEWHSEVLEGENGEKLVLNNVTMAGNYYCFVTDAYGTKQSVCFNVTIENHFRAVAERGVYGVRSGESAEIKVIVLADDLSGVSYQWYENVNEYDADEGGYVTTRKRINGATGSTFRTESITEEKDYFCVVKDRFDNIMEVNFTVSLLNHLQARSKTLQEEYAYGAKASLEVEVYADDMAGLTYEWSKERYVFDANGEESYENVMLDANGTNTLVTDPVTEALTYMCLVTDKYGNTETVSFPVSVENGLRLSKISDCDVITGTNGKAKLEVKARAKEMTGIRYIWTKEDAETYVRNVISDGTTGNLEVTENGYYVCTVIDKYGKAISEGFDIIGFKAESDGDNVVVVPKGGNATLKVKTCLDSSTTLSYRWEQAITGKDEFGRNTCKCIDLGSHSNRLELQGVTKDGEYTCTVTDENGAEEYVDFYVYVDRKKEVEVTANIGKEMQDDIILVPEGQEVKLKANTGGFSGNVTYYWIEDHQLLTNTWSDCEWALVQETKDTITVKPSVPGVTYWYCCYVWDESGQYNSGCIEIRIQADCAVSFKANGGSGSMATVTAQKNYEYVLPECGFTAPKGKTFAGWDVDGEIYEVGESILPMGDVTVKAVWANTAPADVDAVATNLDGKVGLLFYVTMPDYVLADEGAYATLTLNTKDGDVTETQLVKNAPHSPKGSLDRWQFSYYVVAKQMHDKITLNLYLSDGTRVPLTRKGEAVAETGYAYSVIDYCDLAIANSSNAKMVTLAKRLKAYGEMAQIYFDYRAEGLVPDADFEKDLFGGLAAYAEVTSGECPAGLVSSKPQGMVLILEEETTLRVNWKFETGADPNSYEYMIDDAPATLQHAGSDYFLAVENISSKKLGDAHKFTISKDGKSYTWTGSALTWANAAVSKGGANATNMGKALYLYNQAARDYFNY